MVNLAMFNGSLGSQYGSIGNSEKKKKTKDTYILLRQNLTLLKVNNYEDYLVMDVVRADENQNSVTDEQFEELKHAFVAFDWNGDGFIDCEDLGYVMKKLGHDLTSKEVKKIFKEICQHGNGKLDFTDFVEMMAQDKLVLTTNEQEIFTAFKYLDENNDGYITVEELISRFHGCLNEAEANRLMNEADADGDGRIDFEEFKHMMFHHERGISLVQADIELYS